MRNKAIFLVFIIGAVAVPTEKNSDNGDKKEEPGSVGTPSGVKVQYPPNNMSDTEEVHFFISSLNSPKNIRSLGSSEEGYEEAKESPKPSKENRDQSDGFLDYDDSRLYDAGYTQIFFWLLEEELKRQNSSTQEKFDSEDKKIDREEEKFENQLKEKFDAAEENVNNQHEDEIAEAVFQGMYEDNMKECFTREAFDFRSQMDGEYKSALKCVKEAAVEARITLKDSRNAFTEIHKKSSSNAEDWSKKVVSCVGDGNGYCVQKKITDIRKEINKLKGESKEQLENLEKTLKNTEEKMELCIKHFDDKLEEGKGEYFTKMRTCLK